jgi:peptidoglycan/LPS O-acetylase OafA/YrhL
MNVHTIEAPSKTQVAPVSRPNSARESRFASLDGVRGMAILMVMIGHLVGSLGLLGQSRIYDLYFFSTPLHLFFNETDAVTIFFVLSGFVMQLPLAAPTRDVQFISFWGRRFFRLYPVYLLGLVFCMLAYHFLYDAKVINGFNPQLGVFANHPPALGDFFRHLNPLQPSLEISHIDGPLWSLFVEFKLSLVFPVIAACAKRLKWAEFLALTIFVWFLCFQFQQGTLKYFPMFMLGALGAQYREGLVKFVPRNVYAQVAILVGCLCLFEMRFMIGHLPFLSILLHTQYSFHSLTAICTLILMILVLKEGVPKRIFSNGFLTFCGKATFPLYIFSLPFYFIAMSFAGHFITGRMQIFAVAAFGSLAATFALSIIVHKAIEMPCNRVGHRLFNKFSRGNVRTSVSKLLPRY